MGMLMRGFGRVWQRSSVRSTSASARKSTDLRENCRVAREARCSVGFKGARGYHNTGQEPACRARWLSYPLPGHWRLSQPREKLERLRETGSISGFSDWEAISPDEYHDWIAQRSDAFANLYPMGSKDSKAGIADDAIFRLYSRGPATSRDAYIYNFSRDACTENARKMTQDYRAALCLMEENPELTVDIAASGHSSNLKWDRALKDNLKRKKRAEFDEEFICKALYRPFVATNCYADFTFVNCKYQIDRIFPKSSSENRVICVTGIGSTKQFSVLV